MHQIKLKISAVLLIALFSCKRTATQNSDIKFITSSQNALNFLIVVTGQEENTDIPGVHEDPNHVISAFSAINPAGSGPLTYSDNEFSKLEADVDKLVKSESLSKTINTYNSNFITIKVLKATKSRILNAIEKTSSIALKYDPNGSESTGMVYMSSHGSGGWIEATDGDISLSQMSQASIKARNNKPWKRFYFVVDACESGKLLTQVNARGATSNTSSIESNLGFDDDYPYDDFESGFALTTENTLTPDFEIMSKNLNSSATGLAHQIILIASSKANQNSGDTEEGGDFTITFTGAYKKLAQNSSSATLKDWFSKTTQGDYMDQTPQFLVSPASVCSESLTSVNSEVENDSAITKKVEMQRCGI